MKTPYFLIWIKIFGFDVVRITSTFVVNVLNYNIRYLKEDKRFVVTPQKIENINTTIVIFDFPLFIFSKFQMEKHTFYNLYFLFFDKYIIKRNDKEV